MNFIAVKRSEESLDDKNVSDRRASLEINFKVLCAANFRHASSSVYVVKMLQNFNQLEAGNRKQNEDSLV